MFIIRGTNEQIQYAQQLIYERITGVQGSQPPSGFFSNAPGGSSEPQAAYAAAYGGAAPSYQQPQAQQWGYQPQPQQAWPQQQPDPSKGGAQPAAAADPNAAAWAAYYQS